MSGSWKKISSLLFISLLLLNVSAQEIVVGNKLNIDSQILGEKRELWISLPESYSDSTYAPASYPVMFLLDPEFYFEPMVGIRQALTGGMYNYSEEMIIVGIASTDRSRDLTPTNGFVIHSGKKIHETSGGAKQFLSFISDELIPFIDTNYRTNGYRLLNGHSFGGLFAMYVLEEEPQSFNAYLVHDPSIWWDDKTLYKSALQKWDDLNLDGITLYLSVAHNVEMEKDRFEHTQSILMYRDNILGHNTNNGLRYQSEYYENEDHGTIFLPAAYNGLRFVYDGICLPVKQIPDSPNLVNQHYKKLSEQLQFKVVPPEKLVDKIAAYCIQRERYDSAEQLLKMNRDNYPASWHACSALGELYMKQGDESRAGIAFQKAKKLNAYFSVPTIPHEN